MDKAALLGLFLLMGLAGASIGLWLLLKMRSFVARAVPAVGCYGPANWGSTPMLSGATAYSMVNFWTADGRQIEFESKLGVPWAALKAGRDVPVLYDPQDPNEAHINSFMELWAAPLIFLLVGVGQLLAVLGVVIIGVGN